MLLKSALKKLSSFTQSAKTSYLTHNRELETENKLEMERAIAEKNFKDNLINGPELRIIDLLTEHPSVKTAVDIGSGAGWGSAAVSKHVTNVIAIEPSQAGISISKQLYPATDYPNIEWKNGFAENVLRDISLSTPALYMTGCVLSHLRDKEVLKICQAINETAPAGSVLAFSECWSDSSRHQIMWHIRSKEWWQQALPNWKLNFHGPLHINGDCHMGFSGEKN